MFSQPAEYFQPENRLKFGNYLFCSQDYLRAIDEFRSFLKYKNNDTVYFKIGLSYEKMRKYDIAQIYFASYPVKNSLYPEAQLEFYKIFFLKNEFSSLRKRYNKTQKEFKYFPEIKRLNYLTYLFDDLPLPDSNNFKLWFSTPEQREIINYYKQKLNLPQKSLTTAGLLSAVVPGLGKIYAGEIGDGITALIINGLLGFLAYDNFRAGHQFRGWLFTGLTAFFYGGNIYGSVAAAQIFNKRVRVNYEEELRIYLERENYFLPDYQNLCK